jgi:hypothetical protein
MATTPEQARAWAASELRRIYSTVSDWDTAVLDQIVLHLAAAGQGFGMNQIRTIVPEGDFRKAGLYFHTLIGHDALHPDAPKLLHKIDEETSINPKARGKKVNVYVLTHAGRRFIQDRQAARIEQRRTAA